ncbi:MAG: 5-formyltetrahydrofolate cyclo-ligase [Nitrospinota bacterium]
MTVLRGRAARALKRPKSFPFATKEEVRRRVWDNLTENGIAVFPLPPHGRIPNFKGSGRAAELLLDLPEFRRARCVFTGPDYALKAVRDLVLRSGKTLAYATPHMKDFLEIPPEGTRSATTIGALKRHGRPLRTPIDLLVKGSVAVDKRGNRIGKGSGYSDQEVALLRARGLLAPGAKVLTVVHSAQVQEDLGALMDPWDVPVEAILTEAGVIRVG